MRGAGLERRARRWAKAFLPVYHRLPGPVRDLAVSARGWPLARLRASAWAREEVARGESLERDLPAAEAFAVARLRTMLSHAARSVPYYARLFASIGFDPGRVASPADLQALPLLERHVVRGAWQELQSAELADEAAIFTSTSGTMGAGLTVRATPEAYARTWAQQLRHWRWGGTRPGDWRITLFGAEVIPRLEDAGRLWVYNVPERQIFLSAYHLSPAHADRYRERLERRPHVVEGFPSILADLASVIGPARRGRPRARVVYSTGEALRPEVRGQLVEAFGAPVLDQYGQDEKVGFILECPVGTYHQIVEYGILEVVDDAGVAVPDGTEGHLVWTGLVNAAMPLVRYRIGDLGTRLPAGAACPCGVAYPAVAPTVTRTGDSLRLAGGQRVSPRLLNQLLKECRAFAAAQFVQESADRVTLLVERAAGAGDGAAEGEAARLAARLDEQFGGRVRFAARVVPAIAREASAKRRLVVVREGAHVA